MSSINVELFCVSLFKMRQILLNIWSMWFVNRNSLLSKSVQALTNFMCYKYSTKETVSMMNLWNQSIEKIKTLSKKKGF